MRNRIKQRLNFVTCGCAAGDNAGHAHGVLGHEEGEVGAAESDHKLCEGIAMRLRDSMSTCTREEGEVGAAESDNKLRG
jgi:hypothetical protein